MQPVNTFCSEENTPEVPERTVEMLLLLNIHLLSFTSSVKKPKRTVGAVRRPSGETEVFHFKACTCKCDFLFMHFYETFLTRHYFALTF